MENNIAEGFTDEQHKLLDKLQNLVTLDMFNRIEKGEDIRLNDKFSLYRYINDNEDEDFFKVTIVSTNDWDEICDVMIDGENLVFELL